MKTYNNIDDLLKEVSSYKTPIQTYTYKPVNYADLISQCYNKVKDHYEVSEFRLDTSYSKDKDLHTKLNCTMFLDMPDSDINLGFGIVSSHDKSIPVSLAAMGIVKVCTNGMISKGNVLRVRRHTRYVWNDIDTYINLLLGILDTSYKGHLGTIKVLMNKNVSKSDINFISKIAGLAMYDGIFDKMEHFKVFKQEWMNAIENKGNFCNNNMWSVYNWGTEALKQSSIANKFEQHQKWNELILENV